MSSTSTRRAGRPTALTLESDATRCSRFSCREQVSKESDDIEPPSPISTRCGGRSSRLSTWESDGTWCDGYTPEDATDQYLDDLLADDPVDDEATSVSCYPVLSCFPWVPKVRVTSKDVAGPGDGGIAGLRSFLRRKPFENITRYQQCMLPFPGMSKAVSVLPWYHAFIIVAVGDGLALSIEKLPTEIGVMVGSQEVVTKHALEWNALGVKRTEWPWARPVRTGDWVECNPTDPLKLLAWLEKEAKQKYCLWSANCQDFVQKLQHFLTSES